VSDEDFPAVLGDLGGHDVGELLRALDTSDAETRCPSVVFAYTMKGWGLPMAGDPLNHSALLSQAQLDELRPRFGMEDDDWAAFSPESPEGVLCQAAAARLYPNGPGHTDGPLPLSAADVPDSLPTRIAPSMSSQDAFGNALVELSRLPGPLAARLVTTSPDVSVSTSLGGWINRVGVFAVEDSAPGEDSAAPRLLRWQPGSTGQHIELGISEMNLFLLLGQLGLSHEVNGDLLLPVGTVYDPFVCRGLDALIYGTYSASKFVFAGTPAGVPAKTNLLAE
jgi:pyruvate dehydrogenase E1 component